MFEDLLNLPLNEYELFKLLVEEFKANFARFDDTIYIFRLKSHGKQVSSIVEIVTVKPDEYHDWLFSNEYEPRVMLASIQNDVARLDIVGFFYIGHTHFTPCETIRNFVQEYKTERNPNAKMFSREITARGFKEIQKALAATPRNKITK